MWPVALILAGATANFLWQLGAPSYFADEVLSIENALPSLSHVVTAVNKTETNPWTYFLLLHEWIGRTGTDREWTTRLPSAIAGVALVAAIYWLARIFLARGPALAAAALCAISPLVLQYAQEVRGYIWVMLALTIGLAATLRAAEPRSAAGERTAATPLLVLGCLACVVALWLHYMAVLVVGPLCAWLATRTTIPHRQRALYVLACAVAGALTVPMFVEQYKNAGGLNGIAGVSTDNVLALIGVPFAGRFQFPTRVYEVVAALVGAVSLLRLATYRGDRLRHPRLMCVFGATPIAALLLIGLAGEQVIATRYSAVAVPILIVVIVAAIVSLGRAAGLLVTIATGTIAIWGLVLSHSQPGFYPPSKQIVSYMKGRVRPGDQVVFALRLGLDWPFEFYGAKLLAIQPHYIEPGDRTGFTRAVNERKRIWFIGQAPRGESGQTLTRSGTLSMKSIGYRPAQVHGWTTDFTYVLALGVPISPRRPSAR